MVHFSRFLPTDLVGLFLTEALELRSEFGLAKVAFRLGDRLVRVSSIDEEQRAVGWPTDLEGPDGIEQPLLVEPRKLVVATPWPSVAELRLLRR